MFQGKKVLIMGLGLLRGGAEAAKWFARRGAKVTVTDLKEKKDLTSSIRLLGKWRRSIKFVLGRHRSKDFKENEIVVVNPAVPRESKYLKIAEMSGARLENEASLFFRFCKNPTVGVTGTRGKTTTAAWTRHLLKQKYPRAVLTGNSSDNPMLKVLDSLDGKSPVVVELSSWHLELLPQSKKSPPVAVITNLYPDHLNRYPSLESYALAKANIFKNQKRSDFLILNRKNKWTRFFRGLKPSARILYFPPSHPLAPASFKKEFGGHNVLNLEAAALTASVFGVSETAVKKAIKNLPKISFRQEIVYRRKDLVIVNDTTATTPEATMAALTRFRGQGEIILIGGGTDKGLAYKEWAKAVKRCVKPENLYLLHGSATKKMLGELKKAGYFRKSEPQIFENLTGLLKKAKKERPRKAVIIFSPGAASFEKFKNEFDRGRQFNRISLSVF